MRKYICVLAVLLLLLALAGCGGETDVTEPSETVPQESQVLQETEGDTAPVVQTEQDLLELFGTYAEEDWVVIDCVMFDESNYGISGVVQYVTDDYDGCMFDFIKDGQPLRTGVEAQPASRNAALGYAGDDRIVCRLKNSEGEFTCAITCTINGDEVNFKISG